VHPPTSPPPCHSSRNIHQAYSDTAQSLWHQATLRDKQHEPSTEGDMTPYSLPPFRRSMSPTFLAA
jgi:hypothetical protein